MDTSGQAPAYNSLKHEKNSRKENEVGDEFSENLLTAARQQHTADPPPGDADGDEGCKPRFHIGQVFAVSVEAANHPNHERKGACGIGNERGNPEEDERGKCDESPPAGHSIDRSRSTSSGEEGGNFDPRHLEILLSHPGSCDLNVLLVQTSQPVKYLSRISHEKVEDHRSCFGALEGGFRTSASRR